MSSIEEIEAHNSKTFAASSEAKSNFDLVISVIRKNNASFFSNWLHGKAFGILECNRNGWYPLHEAIVVGNLCIVKVIVKYASKHGIDVLNTWDRNLTSQRKNSGENLLNYLRDSHHLHDTEPQISFLRLAVQSGQLDMINYFIKLHKSEIERNILFHLFFKQQKKSQPRNEGVLEAMLESVMQPKILRVLLDAYPEYVYDSQDKYVIFRYAVHQNHVEAISILLPAIFRHYNKNFLADSSLNSPLICLWNYCLSSAYVHGDTTVLKLLYDASHCDISSLNSNDPWICKCMYYALYHCSCYGTVAVIKCLIELGFDVYQFCPKCCNRLYDLRRSLSHSNRSTTLLVEYNSGFSQRKYQPQLSALLWAALGNNVDVLKYLLVIVDKKKFYESQRCCPLEVAVMDCSSETVCFLLEAGFFIDGFDFLNRYFHFFLNCKINSFGDVDCEIEVVKILVKFGALELLFGQSCSTNELKQYLKYQWMPLIADSKINNFPEGHIWGMFGKDKVNELNCYYKFTTILLQHIELFKLEIGKKLCFEENVPSLKQLCRYIICCCFVQKFKTLQPMWDLPLPFSLLNFLFSLDTSACK